jgi:hypothetical protein
MDKLESFLVQSTKTQLLKQIKTIHYGMGVGIHEFRVYIIF